MLTPRLECIARHSYGSVAADIGTDHAYVPIELIENGQIQRAIACDINEGPLKNAQSNIDLHGIGDKITTRMGDGLSALQKGEADLIIIAGMGGKLITKLLADNMEIAKSAAQLVLQPMNAQCELRHFLEENSFYIENEDMATEEFKVYNILTVRPGGKNTYDEELDYHIPKTLYSHELFNMLCHKKKREFEKITAGLKKSTDTELSEKLNAYTILLERLGTIYEGI